MYSAYFDRTTVNNQAVLLIESDLREILLPAALLPEDSEPGNWFLITVQDDTVTSIQFDEEKTTKMANDVQSRLARLQSRKKSRFKKR